MTATPHQLRFDLSSRMPANTSFACHEQLTILDPDSQLFLSFEVTFSTPKAWMKFEVNPASLMAPVSFSLYSLATPIGVRLQQKFGTLCEQLWTLGRVQDSFTGEAFFSPVQLKMTDTDKSVLTNVFQQFLVSLQPLKSNPTFRQDQLTRFETELFEKFDHFSAALIASCRSLTPTTQRKQYVFAQEIAMQLQSSTVLQKIIEAGFEPSPQDILTYLQAPPAQLQQHQKL